MAVNPSFLEDGTPADVQEVQQQPTDAHEAAVMSDQPKSSDASHGHGYL